MSIQAQVVIQGGDAVQSAPARCENPGGVYGNSLGYVGAILDTYSLQLGLRPWCDYCVSHAALFDELSSLTPAEEMDEDEDELDDDAEEQLWELVLAKAPYYDVAEGLRHARALIDHLERDRDVKRIELERVGYDNVLRDLHVVAAILEDAEASGSGFHIAID